VIASASQDAAVIAFRTRLTDRLGIRLPIPAGGLQWLADIIAGLMREAGAALRRLERLAGRA
jgi:hypothetical protein